MNQIPLGAKVIAFLVAGLVALMLFLAIWPFTSVEPGQRAIVIRLSGIDRVLDQGTHLKWPLIEEVVRYDVRVQKDETPAAAASADLQTVSAVIAVNYFVDPSTVADTYTRIGKEDVIKTKVIDPAVQEIVKASTAKYKADELLTKRPEVADLIETSLKERLAQYNVIVTDVSVVNFDFSSSFNAAVEAKVTAQQEALKAQNDLERIQFEAQQKIETAKAEAEAIRIQAQAITQQGGKDYVALKAIEKWNGQLPQQFVPGSAVPFLNLSGI